MATPRTTGQQCAWPILPRSRRSRLQRSWADLADNNEEECASDHRPMPELPSFRVGGTGAQGGTAATQAAAAAKPTDTLCNVSAMRPPGEVVAWPADSVGRPMGQEGEFVKASYLSKRKESQSEYVDAESGLTWTKAHEVIEVLRDVDVGPGHPSYATAVAAIARMERISEEPVDAKSGLTLVRARIVIDALRNVDVGPEHPSHAMALAAVARLQRTVGGDMRYMDAKSGMAWSQARKTIDALRNADVSPEHPSLVMALAAVGRMELRLRE